jgi:hypothetical protein
VADDSGERENRTKGIWGMTVNAFNWKQYTDEEHAKNGGDPFKKMKHDAKISLSTSVAVAKLQRKNPYHGTIIGLSDKADDLVNAYKRNRINRDLEK